jgi:hypothetical protein
LYIGGIAGDVELGLGGRHSAAPCLTLGHIAGFDNMRLRSALEARAFAERETFAAVAAYPFPAGSRPKCCVNIHSEDMIAGVPLADRDPADRSHSYRSQKGHRLDMPSAQNRIAFIVAGRCSWRAITI